MLHAAHQKDRRARTKDLIAQEWWWQGCYMSLVNDSRVLVVGRTVMFAGYRQVERQWCCLCPETLSAVLALLDVELRKDNTNHAKPWRWKRTVACHFVFFFFFFASICNLKIINLPMIFYSEILQCPTDGEICLSQQRQNITKTETYYKNRNNSRNAQ